ncbi:MAG TPA: hypothetical protein VHU40_16680 [Polyangia bacterium]|nr:hypothetical protein [Polyangia bacterium]
MSPADKPPRPRPTATENRPAAKRPWQTPRVRTGQLFESNSLACGKNTPLIPQCVQNPMSS